MNEKFTSWNYLDLDHIIKFRINKQTLEVEFKGNPENLKYNEVMKK